MQTSLQVTTLQAFVFSGARVPYPLCEPTHHLLLSSTALDACGWRAEVVTHRSLGGL